MLRATCYGPRADVLRADVLRADVLCAACYVLRAAVATGLLRQASGVHVVLLGDSVFDNAAYTGGEPDVLTHLQRLLPSSWRASLLAVDGATAARFRSARPAARRRLAPRRLDGWQRRARPCRSPRYSCAYHGRRVCTIYNGALPDAGEARRARVALAMFNDVILGAAWQQGCAVLELRLLCVEPRDYANPIEPSGQGGAKIARAVARAVGALGDHEPCLYAPRGSGV